MMINKQVLARCHSIGQGVRWNAKMPLRSRSPSDQLSLRNLWEWWLRFRNLSPPIGPIRTFSKKSWSLCLGSHQERFTSIELLNYHKMNVTSQWHPGGLWLLMVSLPCQDLREGHFRQRCEVSAESRELFQAVFSCFVGLSGRWT